jgi:NAD(P)-dependent dehydrogenase (short-subunit alcohol dehydrogenase family)
LLIVIPIGVGMNALLPGFIVTPMVSYLIIIASRY